MCSISNYILLHKNAPTTSLQTSDKQQIWWKSQHNHPQASAFCTTIQPPNERFGLLKHSGTLKPRRELKLTLKSQRLSIIEYLMNQFQHQETARKLVD